MSRVTAEMIDAARTPAGGWTKVQLAEWGVSWPPLRGWRKRLIAGLPDEREERGLDLSTIKERNGVAPVFTPEQEARLRQIIREEIVEDHVRHSGFTGELADGYRASLIADLNAPTASEAPRA